MQIMKSDEDVRMISAEAPVLFARVRAPQTPCRSCWVECFCWLQHCALTAGACRVYALKQACGRPRAPVI